MIAIHSGGMLGGTLVCGCCVKSAPAKAGRFLFPCSRLRPGSAGSPSLPQIGPGCPGHAVASQRVGSGRGAPPGTSRRRRPRDRPGPTFPSVNLTLINHGPVAWTHVAPLSPTRPHRRLRRRCSGALHARGSPARPPGTATGLPDAPRGPALSGDPGGRRGAPAHGRPSRGGGRRPGRAACGRNAARARGRRASRRSPSGAGLRHPSGRVGSRAVTGIGSCGGTGTDPARHALRRPVRDAAPRRRPPPRRASRRTSAGRSPADRGRGIR
jgi:hypothetical protein